MFASVVGYLLLLVTTLSSIDQVLIFTGETLDSPRLKEQLARLTRALALVIDRIVPAASIAEDKAIERKNVFKLVKVSVAFRYVSIPFASLARRTVSRDDLCIIQLTLRTP